MKQISNSYLLSIWGTACLLVLFSATAVAQNTYFITGIVKELHAEKQHLSKPLVLANVKVMRGHIEQYATVSKANGIFSVNMAEPLPNLALRVNYQDYEVLDEAPLKNVIPVKDAAAIGVYILMCSKAKLKKLEDEYFEKIKLRLSIPYDERIRKLKDTMDTRSAIYRDSVETLTRNYEDQLSKAQKFAQTFVRTEFQDPDNPLFKAYQFYLNGNLDSCEYYYERDNFLSDVTTKHISDNRVIIDNWLIYAEAKTAKEDWESVDKIYNKAIEAANTSNKYTVVKAYTAFLLERERFVEARDFLTMKMELLKNIPDSLDEVLYTNYQFAELYQTNKYSQVHNPLADPKLCSKHAAAIITFRSQILTQTGKLQNQGVLLKTMQLIAEEQTRRSDKYKKLQDLYEVVKSIDEHAFDTLNISVPQPADVSDLLADYYKEKGQMFIATMYYRDGIRYRQRHLLRSKEKDNITDNIFYLYCDYFFIATSSFNFPAITAKYLRKESEELRPFRKKMDIEKLKKFLLETADALEKGNPTGPFTSIMQDFIKNGKSIFSYNAPADGAKEKIAN